MIKKIVEVLLKRIKGKQILLDDNLTDLDLLEIVYVRGLMLLRASLRGWNSIIGTRCIVFFGQGVVILHRKYITIGSGSTLGRGTKINGLSKRGVKLGVNVNLGDHTIINCTGSFSDLGEGVKIGNNVGIGGFSYIGAAGGIDVGDNCIMGTRIGFYAESHNYDNIDLPIKDQGVNRKGIRIGANCWVGSNVIFLDGCDVGDGCVIGAGSVINKAIPNNSIIAGVPARIIGSRGA